MQLVFPSDRSIDRITYRMEAPQGEDCLAHAFEHPIQSPPLREIAKDKRSAVILISDISRLCPSYLFLERMLNELNAAGLPDSRIRIVVALGMHRKQTEQELRRLAGEAVYRRVQVLNHSPLSEDCVPLGMTSMGTPIEINRHVAEAELRVVTGNIEPHALAGMSGGIKALVPGVASHRCIEHNHGLSRRFKAEIGNPDNPVRQDLEEALQFLPVHFLFNVIVNHEQKVLEAVSGDIIAAHRAALQAARERFIIEVAEPYDTVIVSAGGYPKDTQLYQAVKSLKNAATITKPGGKIVLAAKCEEIFGNGIFQYWVETIQDRKLIVDKLKEQFVLGAHKIEHIDQVLQNHEVFLYSDMPHSLVELVGFQPVSDLQACIDKLLANPYGTIALMPFGGLTFPALKGTPGI